MTCRAIVILFVLGTTAQADAQGFAPGQVMRFDGSSHFPPPDFERDSPQRSLGKAREARDHHAAARRLAEKDRAAKESELADLDAAANGVEQDAARVEAGALDSARKLGSRIAQSQSTNPTTKGNAGLGGLSDVAKTKVAFDDFGDGFLVRLGPERARLRRDISKLTRNIDIYRRQEAYWQAKADEAESEIEAIAEAGWHGSRVRSNAAGVQTSALEKAWAQDQGAAARAKDNVQSQSQTPGQGSSQNARSRDGDPPCSGGERAKDPGSSRGEVSGGANKTGPGVRDNHVWK
jgi:hypothetical protein